MEDSINSCCVVINRRKWPLLCIQHLTNAALVVLCGGGGGSGVNTAASHSHTLDSSTLSANRKG